MFKTFLECFGAFSIGVIAFFALKYIVVAIWGYLFYLGMTSG